MVIEGVCEEKRLPGMVPSNRTEEFRLSEALEDDTTLPTLEVRRPGTIIGPDGEAKEFLAGVRIGCVVVPRGCMLIRDPILEFTTVLGGGSVIPDACLSSDASSSSDLIGDIGFISFILPSRDAVDRRRSFLVESLTESSDLGSCFWEDGPSTGDCGVEGFVRTVVITDGLTGNGRIKGLDRWEGGLPPAASSFSLDRPARLGN
jgi:hypothetical protein